MLMGRSRHLGGRARIVLIGLNYAPETTGIAPYTTGLARHLAASGHDVTVITGHPHYPEWALHAGYETPRQPTQEAGVHLIRVSHPVPRNPTGLSRVWMEFVFSLRAARHLLRRDADAVVVISPALLSLIPVVMLRPLKRYRVGVVVQDLYGAALAETGLGGGLTSRVVAALEGGLLKRAAGVVAIHEVFRRRLLARGIPDDRILVVPNWAHITMPANHDRSTIRAALGWGEDEFIALHAGNMGAKQGLEGLVDVAALAHEQKSQVRIVLMGSGSRREALEGYAKGIPAAIFLDPLPQGDFEAALAAADCLLLHEKPGVVEMSVPSKLTTYFTAGRPVVAATDLRSGAANLMSESQAGLIVKPGCPAGILAAIESLSGDEEAASKMARDGMAYAATHLTQSASLAQKEAWVRGLLGQRSGRLHGFRLRVRRLSAQGSQCTKDETRKATGDDFLSSG
jgi:colanic acid biosynthesis glycosyl transferase WcaI